MIEDDDLDEGEEEKELSDLEKEFKVTAEKVTEEINQKLNLASNYLSEAVRLSEKHGIPFDTNISFLGQSYTPKSFDSKYADVDSELVEELTGVYDMEYDGWLHSAVC